MEKNDDTDRYLHKLEKKICGKLKKSDKNQKSLKTLLECLRKERKKEAVGGEDKKSKEEPSFNEDECKMLAEARSALVNQRKRDERIQRINEHIAKNDQLYKETILAKKKGHHYAADEVRIVPKGGVASKRGTLEELSSREMEDQARLTDSMDRRRIFESFARAGNKKPPPGSKPGEESSSTEVAHLNDTLRKRRLEPDAEPNLGVRDDFRQETNNEEKDFDEQHSRGFESQSESYDGRQSRGSDSRSEGILRDSRGDRGGWGCSSSAERHKREGGYKREDGYKREVVRSREEDCRREEIVMDPAREELWRRVKQRRVNYKDRDSSDNQEGDSYSYRNLRGNIERKNYYGDYGNDKYYGNYVEEDGEVEQDDDEMTGCRKAWQM